MPQADPFIENPKRRPYECLGIPRTASYEEAKEAVKDLHGEHKTQAKKNEGINEKKKQRHQEALENIRIAFEIIKEGDSLSLHITDEPDQLEVGEEGTVKVVDDQGTALEAIDIAYDNTTLDTTNKKGLARVRFQEPGRKQITAQGGNTESADTTITIKKRKVKLNLQVSKKSLRAKENVEFKVVDQNNRKVSDVEIDIKDGPTQTTDDDGKAEVVFDDPGEYDITLSKDINTPKVTYENETTSILVKPEETELTLNEIEGDLVAGNKASFQITTKNQRPVQGAVVETNHGDKTRTDSDGWADIQITNNENIVLRARTDDKGIDYDDFQTTLTVQEAKREIYIEGVPDFATTGEQIQFRVVDQNQNPIENARIVSSRGSEEWFSDADGRVTVDVNDQPGVEVFTADKSDEDFENGPAEFRLLIRA